MHHAPQPLVLPNAWDAASARLVEAAGFPVIATSSGAIAASLGYEDNDSMPPAEAFAAIARIARSVTLPVTADCEAGYQLDPGEFVEQLLDSGAVGCNLEDTDHHSEAELIPTTAQARFLAAVKEAGRSTGVDLVVNARIDIFRSRGQVTDEMLEEGITRAKAYLAAGADCLFPIRLQDEVRIEEFARRLGAPVNIMLTPTAPSVQRLAELGVSRISLAGGIMRHAYDSARVALQELSAQVDNPDLA
jgi:2-methylisocitrate lyase-like PEP mutase family enzyme